MDILYRQLVAFLAVANLRSFTAAAQVMHLTQGAVSVLIKELEERTGVQLFDRTSRSVKLSRAGEDFSPYARRAVEHLRSAQQFAADMRDHRVGLVRVVGAPLITCTLLPRMLSIFSDVQPAISVSLVDAPMSDLQSIISRGDADIGLGPERKLDIDVIATPLFATPVSVVCHPDHRFAENGGTTWAELRNEPIIIVGEEMIHHIGLEFGDARFTIAQIVNHITTALALAAVGKGVVLAGTFVSQLSRAYGLAVCPLTNPTLRRQMMIYRHKAHSVSPAVTSFIDFLNQHVREKDPNAINE